jgi:hypothetical protein
LIETRNDAAAHVIIELNADIAALNQLLGSVNVRGQCE